jgi:murein DD-endopeptidase MepM/ murein hydrolase activator NlpD
VVILLSLGLIVFSQVRIPSISFFVPAPASYAGEDLESADVAVAYVGPRPIIRESASLVYAPVPHTTIPDRHANEIITYTVRPNDTVWGIAQAFGIEVETIMWANPEVESEPDLLSVGQVLTILPVNGVYYTVKAGDTVDKLAKTYKTTKEKIVGLALNGLADPYTLVAGQKVVLPDGQKPLPKPKAPLDFGKMTFVGTPPKGAAKGTGKFMWPTRGYWSRGVSRYHKGVDIANSIGTPIYAADAGYVMLAGRDTAGYGLQVVINHGNGFHSRYAHLSKILVKAGQSVKRGEKIALMGNTGRSTGPHLHFEVIKNGVIVNPLSYLPR